MQKTLLFSLIIVLVANIAIAQNYSGGTGTQEDPFQISSLEDLRYLSIYERDRLDEYFILINDINAAETRWWDSSSTSQYIHAYGFNPIGDPNKELSGFYGTFDGQGYVIDSLYIRYVFPFEDASFVGLFAKASGTIKNLGLTNCDISADNCSCYFGAGLGALIGYSQGAIITNCYVTGKISAKKIESISIGGLVGWSEDANIKNCWTDVEIFLDANVANGSTVGGFIGNNNDGMIQSCFAKGNIYDSGNFEYYYRCGGFCGMNLRDGDIFECYSKMDIHVKSNFDAYVGGFCGFNYRGANIKNCYAMGNIIYDTTTIKNARIFGFCANNYSSVIKNCYTTTNISYIQEDKPLNIGFSGTDHNSTYSINFYDTEATGQDSAIGATGKTTNEMKQQATFTDWDFENVWMMDPDINNAYPTFRWEHGIVPLYITDYYPEDESFTFHLDITLVITFNRNVIPNKGKIILFDSGDRAVEMFDVSQDIEIKDNKVILQPTQTLKPRTGYYVIIEADCFYDDQGMFNKGMIDKETWNFRTLKIDTIYGEKPTAWRDGYGGTIYTLEELNWFTHTPEAWDEDWKLGADIDASSTKEWDKGFGFLPIGKFNDSLNFTGNFDGQGHTISNLSINRPEEDTVGFFEVVDNSHVQNVNLVDYLITGYEYVGGLIGKSINQTVISNCHVSGIIEGWRYTGGLIAYTNYSEIINSSADIELVGRYKTGGLIGNLGDYSIVKNSFVTGIINGEDGIGGFVGFSEENVEISCCFFDGVISAKSSGSIYGFGGFIGGCYSGDLCKISNCYAKGTFSLAKNIENAGLALFSGEVSLGNIGNCYSAMELIFPGDITTTDRGFAGGKWHCYFENNFFDTEVSQQDSAIGATGKTTAEMKQEDTFANWDFENVWYIDSSINDGYPELRWKNGLAPISIEMSYPEKDNPIFKTIFDISISFNQDVLIGNGNITLYHSDGDVIEVFDVTKDAVILGSSITFDLNSILNYNETYYFLIDSTCFYNNNGEYYGGIYNSTDWDFRVIKEIAKVEVPDNWEDGKGGIIYNINELLWFSETPEAWDEDWKLGANIDAKETRLWNSGSGFLPIGVAKKDMSFTGSFNGQGFAISNLYIFNANRSYCGLFAIIDSAEIKNVNLTECDLTGINNVAAFVGVVNSDSEILNCHADGDICGVSWVGGCIGSCDVPSLIQNCSFTGEVICEYMIGGGFIASSAATISNCHTNADIKGYFDFGGFIGRTQENANLSNCSFIGNVEIQNNEYLKNNLSASNVTGGFIGNHSANSVIEECFCNSNTTGNRTVGGFCGLANGLIRNCYVKGSVNANEDVGGFCGFSYSGNMENNYSSVIINNGHDSVAGFIAIEFFATLINNFYDKDIAQVDSAIGATGKTTAEMKQQATFTDWDFEKIWLLDGNINDGYPDFRWRYDLVPVYIEKTFPPDDTTRIAINTDLIMEFNAWVIPNEGKITLYESDNTIIDIFDVKNDITIEYNTATIELRENLKDTTDYYVLIDSLAFCYDAGICFLGLKDSTKWNFRTDISDTMVAKIPENWSDSSGGIIYTLGELRWLSENPIAWNEDWKLGADIDASETKIWNQGRGFSNIGNYYSHFIGSFDGQNHTIRNLYINDSQRDYVGLFGKINSAVLQNINLENSNITADIFVGGLCGLSLKSTIRSCHISGDISGSNTVGGLIGTCKDSCFIEDCSSNTKIQTENKAGGLVASTMDKVIIKNSSAIGSVTGLHGIGGFIGNNDINGQISNCYSSSDVEGTIYVGGFCAHNVSSQISSCYSNSQVTGRRYLGGFVGKNYKSTINNCYAMGNIIQDQAVNSSSACFCGVNNMSNINNSYSATMINFHDIENPKNRGFIGEVSGDNLLLNNFYDSQLSQQDSSIGATGKTTNEMKQQATFIDWDFDNIWNISPEINEGYPFFKDLPVLSVEEEITSTTVGSLLLYPNPTNNFLYVNFNGIIKNIKIYDITARLIFTTNERLIDVSNLSHGCYFLVLETEDAVITKNFIKE